MNKLYGYCQAYCLHWVHITGLLGGTAALVDDHGLSELIAREVPTYSRDDGRDSFKHKAMRERSLASHVSTPGLFITYAIKCLSLRYELLHYARILPEDILITIDQLHKDSGGVRRGKKTFSAHALISMYMYMYVA